MKLEEEGQKLRLLSKAFSCYFLFVLPRRFTVASQTFSVSSTSTALLSCLKFVSTPDGGVGR